MSELKPCPFCGGEATAQAPNMHQKTCITCKSCGMSTRWGDKEAVTAARDRRAQLANEPNPIEIDTVKNKPLTLHFGRGELGVGTAYEVPDGPPREINIRQLPSPLPIASDTGDKGKYVDELENVLVRMRFENAESARVLERAVRTVLAGFGDFANEALTLEELRGMDGDC